MPIRVLTPEVAQKIAAGEVIERPASVVKELVENALDAGAFGIQVEIRGGGLDLIRVTDDGAGIPANEVELAFLRHATSKLSLAEDLAAIQTLGFRGEALASVAAVSRITLYTRHADEDLGVSLTIEAGQVVERKPWAGPVGSTLNVRNLFYSVPARLKFLRSATGEAGQIGHLVEAVALGHPDVRFRFINDGRRVFDTPGSGDLRDALRQIHGPAVAESMLAIDETADASHLRIWGLIGLPDQTRATRGSLAFFVNGRRVSNLSLGYAVEEAYRPALLPGRHPIVALHLYLPSEDVDCNVHPTKAEVRLLNERLVTSAVHRAVRAALLTVAPVPEIGAPLAAASWPGPSDWFEAALDGPQPIRPAEVAPDGRSAEAPIWALPYDGSGETAPVDDRLDGRGAGVGRYQSSSTTPAAPVEPTWTAPEIGFRPTTLRPVGQVQNTYIVAEGPTGVFFVDQHTAHERVLYEEILARRSGPDLPAQALLAPVVVQLSATQRAALLERGSSLSQLGFSFEEFGPDSFQIRAVPPQLVKADLERAFRDAADALAGEPVGPDGADRLAATLACHSAVRAGDPLTPDEIRRLLATLEQVDVNRYCPHGRPIVVHLPVAQLERDFHRR
ncbi:MAG TPA: DNA mismatch repair endonuclease MutL [Chloroflexota bacterium]|nr:DNA mismatch repair endonuclease MutL [Chloroflexota bacterium]